MCACECDCVCVCMMMVVGWGVGSYNWMYVCANRADRIDWVSKVVTILHFYICVGGEKGQYHEKLPLTLTQRTAIFDTMH